MEILKRNPENDLVKYAEYFNTPIVSPMPLTPRGTNTTNSNTFNIDPEIDLEGNKVNGEEEVEIDLANLQSESELRAALEADGVDPTPFGEGKAKTLKALLKELKEGSSFLERNDETLKIQRVVEPVFIQLRWHNLVLIEGIQVMEDGRERKRNMLIAEKKDREDEGIGFTAIRGLYEELGIPIATLQAEGIVKFRDDLYCFELEKLDSASYPGLPCVYRTHYVQLDIMQTGYHVFEQFALPLDGCSAANFTTDETSALGTKTHYWKWIDVQEAKELKIKKFPPEIKQEKPEVPEDLKAITTVEQLKAVFEADGINVSQFGVGKAKSLEQLFAEIQEQSSVLERCPKTKKVQRVVEPVFIKLRWKNLVLVEKEQQMADGKIKKRNMLIAEKKEPRDESPYDTCIRGFCEELGFTKEALTAEGVLSYREDLYCCRTENLDSASYPGLPCVYRTHYTQCDVLEGGLQTFAFLGLPDGNDCVTDEKGRKHFWSWYDCTLAKQQKVKGYRGSTCGSTVGQKQLVDPKAYPPKTVEELETLLKADNISVHLWGVGKARTLKALLAEVLSGACTLERSQEDFRLLRVMEIAYIVFKWQGDTLVGTDPEQDPKVMSRQNSVGNLLQLESVAQELLGIHKSELNIADTGSPVPNSDGTGIVSMSLEEVLERKIKEGALKEPRKSTVNNQNSPGRVKYREDINCFEVENYESASFPGLKCIYRTKHVHLEQRSSEQDTMKRISEEGPRDDS